MLVSDLIGLIASFFLLIPAAKDQFYRFNVDKQNRKAQNSPWPGARHVIASAWRVRRESYDGWDSLCMALGAFGLFVAFLLKLLSG